MDYKKEYDKFLKAYSLGNTTGEETGLLVANLAQTFMEINTDTAKKEIVFNRKFASIADAVDEGGKPMSVAKADAIARASDEYEKYNEARRELESVEQIINALKTLQKGALQEYAHMGNQ